MLDKDIKYSQNQVILQKERVAIIQARIDKLNHQLDMWDEAIRSIKEQKAEHINKLNSAKTEYKTQLKDLQRMESHLKNLQKQKKMLKNQHNFVED